MVKELSSQAGGAVCREGGGMVLLEGMVVSWLAVKQRLKRPKRPESLREDVRVSAATCAASTTMEVQPRPWCSKERKQASPGAMLGRPKMDFKKRARAASRSCNCLAVKGQTDRTWRSAPRMHCSSMSLA